MRCLVTGGAGFIGSNLVEELCRRGSDARVFDNFSTGSRANLAELDCEVAEGDLRDLDAVRRAVSGCEVVFHQGALPSVPRSIADPSASHAVNVTGTLNVLVASRDAGVRRVVVASSSSVYGNAPERVKHEELPPRPLSPYAVGKMAAEYYCRVFASVYGLETLCLRYFNVFGPRQDPASQYAAVIPLFTSRALQGIAPVINGDGEQSRDFTFVRNVVEGNLLAAGAASASGEVLNIACGGGVSVNSLASGILGILDRRDIVPEHGPERAGDIRDSRADISKARRLLGYEPLVGFEDGLRMTVEWIRDRLRVES
jgi:nucleoside-diphosphate-sugar epimerase